MTAEMPIRLAVAAFALAWLALSLSIASSQHGTAQHDSAQHDSAPHDSRHDSTAHDSTPHERSVPPPLVLLSVNRHDKEVLLPQRDDGGFTDADLKRAAVAFCQQSPGKVHPLAPRLLDLVYRTMRHFDAEVVHVVSGFRRDRAGSRHTQGRAVDMRIEGIATDRLAAYVREFGFVGVGFYPKSGFVHLDVRDASYFWTDDSAPNAPSHIVPVLEAEARKADADARARGETPDVYVPNNIAEDTAAAKVYARRARQRQAAAQPAQEAPSPRD